MTEMNQENGLRMATLLAGSIKGMALYPSGHPAIVKPVEDMVRMVERILRGKAEVSLGVVDGTFFFEEHLYVMATATIEELVARLEEKELGRIIFSQGLNLQGLSLLVSLLGKSDLKAEAMNRQLATEGLKGIRIEAAGSEDDEEIEGACLRTYHQALAAVEQVFKEVEDGRIPASGQVVAIVREMASLAIKDSSTFIALSMIKDYDNYTFNHSINVGVISMAIAAYLGFNREDTEAVGLAGFLHDLGKIRIEKKILNKPGKLTSVEFEEMKKHTESGTEIISKMEGITPLVAQAVLGHHIGYNRQGYPEWARQMTFTSMSEIVAIADCYDAITTVRVYRRASTPKDAMAELQSISGSYLNGELVDKFREMMGPYPVGSVVRLNNNEIAVVCRSNMQQRQAPEVRIVLDAAGKRLATPVRQKLIDDDGNSYASIVDVVDPLVRNIDVASCLGM